jgi:hypothetical protein
MYESRSPPFVTAELATAAFGGWRWEPSARALCTVFLPLVSPTVDRLYSSRRLESPKRIKALIMVMTLSLLMYSLAEQPVRGALAEAIEHIWDHKDKPTQLPTIRWPS